MREPGAHKNNLSFFKGAICGFVCAAVLSSILSWYTHQGKVVARVNGQSVRYGELSRTLQKVHGLDVLNFLVEKKLIAQEAKKRNLQVNKRKVTSRLSELKKTYKSEEEFSRFLRQRHLTVKDLEEHLSLSVDRVQTRMKTEILF